MLMLFAFSITPTIVFHNWLARHTDTVKKSAETKGRQLGKQTFNCHCDHVVAESPFTEPNKTVITFPTEGFPLFNAELQVQYISSHCIHYSLRGPPTV
jgi:hypothetical protein